jgi:hypothetical protein
LLRRYVSHSSGGGYPKLQVQNSTNSIRSFTMSVDRGFMGVPSKVKNKEFL